MIPFNKPYLTGNELQYIKEAVGTGKISGNGMYTQKVHKFFQEEYSFKKVLLTTSCTDALEMAALLINTNPDDEIIIPSYTFVSSALAFVREGAKIVFADSSEESPNIDVDNIEKLITERTKAIVVVHYAGIAVDMDKLMELARKYNLYVIEDAAQSIDSFYKNRPLGGIGDLSTFSFHETKNIISGEGGMLVINNEKFIDRSEILWEKGTNRASFFRGEVNKYGWVDFGSSFLPSEIIAAFLYAQIEKLEMIQDKRKQLWNEYYNNLLELEQKGILKLPYIPDYATNNAHMFYLVCKDIGQRSLIIDTLKSNNIHSVFHYLSLHSSPFYKDKHDGRVLENSDKYSDSLLRLPMYYELEIEDIKNISNIIKEILL